MKSGLSRRVNKTMRKRKGRISQTMFDIISRTVIIFLCLYITGHCVSVIFGEDLKQKILDGTGKMTKAIIHACIDKKSEILEFLEEKSDEVANVKEKVKNTVMDSEIMEFVEEITTEAPTEENGIATLLVEMEKENAATLNSTSFKSSATEKETTKEEKKEDVKETFAGKTIVPIPKITGKRYNYINLISFDNTIKKFYTVTSATSIKESDMNIQKALKMKFKIEGSNDKPQILIYHTHSQEKFADSKSGSSQSIVAVGDYLAEILTDQFGYNVIHDTSTYDIVNGKLDRNVAYEQARAGVSKILKDNPTINLVLDIHRDGVNDNVHLVTEVNGKQTAQIMFFNGMSRFKDSGDIDYLYNPYLKQNLALSLQMKVNAEAYYPGFTRRNYLNAFQYNLDLCEKSMLVEMGAQTNTFQEVKNAAEPLAMLVHLTMGE